MKKKDTVKSRSFPLLTEREEAVLEAVVTHFIRNAEPVGSRRLAKDFNLSSATIRNIMADLEDYGLLDHPHVSAGRVPSDEGYRYFVRKLLAEKDVEKPDLATRKKIKESLDGKNEVEIIMKNVSDLLSEISSYAGVVVAPKIINTIYKRIQFIRLSDHRVLAIFVARSGIVQNKVIVTDQSYSQQMLDKISNLLNDRFEDMTLSEIRAELVRMMEAERRQYDKLLDSAAQLGEKSLKKEFFEKEEVYVEGAINILELPDFKNFSKLRDLFRTFTERTAMVRLLDKCLDSDGVCVAIGDEADIPDLKDMSVVTSKYSLDDNLAGGLGVIGPKRMPYMYVVSLVKYMADVLSIVLRDLDNSREQLEKLSLEGEI